MAARSHPYETARKQKSDAAKTGHGCRSVWMSATLRPDWLRTVDFKDRIDEKGRIDGREVLSLSDGDHNDADVARRRTAKKPLAQTEAILGDTAALATKFAWLTSPARARSRWSTPFGEPASCLRR